MTRQNTRVQRLLPIDGQAFLGILHVAEAVQLAVLLHFDSNSFGLSKRQQPPPSTIFSDEKRL